MCVGVVPQPSGCGGGGCPKIHGAQGAEASFSSSYNVVLVESQVWVLVLSHLVTVPRGGEGHRHAFQGDCAIGMWGMLSCPPTRDYSYRILVHWWGCTSKVSQQERSMVLVGAVTLFKKLQPQLNMW